MNTRSRRKRRAKVQKDAPQKETPVPQTADILPECQSSCVPSSSRTSFVTATRSSTSLPRQFNSCSRLQRGRSPSPARLNRYREHSELQQLNGRLSSHADHVKQLQAENARLRLQLEALEGVIKRETTNIKQLHGFEIKSLQELLDKCLEDKSQLEAKCQEIQTENEQMSRSLQEKTSDLISVQERLDDLKYVAAAYKKLQAEYTAKETALSESMEDVKRLSAELVKEKRCNRRLEEEARFNKDRYLSELEEASARFSEHLHQADQKLEEGYETLVSDALASVRGQHIRDLESLRTELTSTYHTKLTEWKTKCEVAQADLLAMRREVKVTKQDHDKLRDNVTVLKADKAALEVQLAETRERLEEHKEKNERDRCQAQREVALLTQELTEVKEELEEMGGANSRLEAEINVYRLLVEELEEQTPTKDTNKTHQKKKRCRKMKDIEETLLEELPQGKGKKRKRAGANGNQTVGKTDLADILTTAAKQDFFRTNEFSQGIDILDVDPDGKYVTLVNTTDHPVDLCLWCIQQTDVTEQRIRYEINSSTQLPRGKRLTIWSSDMGPNTDLEDESSLDVDSTEEFSHGTQLTMTGQSWLKLDQKLAVRVEDGDGQLQAKCDINSFKENVDAKKTWLTPQLQNPPGNGSLGSASAVKASSSTSCIHSSKSADLDSGVDGEVCASSSFAVGARVGGVGDNWKNPPNLHDKDGCKLM